ncbi:hypothetical protein, partial [Megamonas funiformis]|uniref:hypothetical protein n=1 Tax=Megamonas funiformis TaxID=437897 RepID=UPI00289E9CF8
QHAADMETPRYKEIRLELLKEAKKIRKEWEDNNGPYRCNNNFYHQLAFTENFRPNPDVSYGNGYNIYDVNNHLTLTDNKIKNQTSDHIPSYKAVEKFLINLSKDNISRKLFIPESRIIDGGYPFIKKLYSIKNYDIHFIPDCSLFHFMKNVDACFMGAETLYADGTGFNTTGSDIVGLICNYYHIPLYFLTPMIKLDTRSIEGFHKELVIDDLYIKLTKNWDLDINKNNIQFKTPELVPVNPNFIYAYITEYGIIPANQMYNIALNYINNLQKDVILNE